MQGHTPWTCVLLSAKEIPEDGPGACRNTIIFNLALKSCRYCKLCWPGGGGMVQDHFLPLPWPGTECMTKGLQPTHTGQVTQKLSQLLHVYMLLRNHRPVQWAGVLRVLL